MTQAADDLLIQAAWLGTKGRQFSIEFALPFSHLWMLKIMARAIDPNVNNQLSTTPLAGLNRPTSFIFSSQALAEVFAENASSLPERIVRMLQGIE